MTNPTWRVFKKPSEKAESLLRGTLRLMSARLIAQYEAEREVNEHEMHSGLPLEDYFRSELGILLRPYNLEPGTIVDRERQSCGDCDVIITERKLAPHLRPPTTALSRRRYFPFEATYGVIEVKQSLTLGALDRDGKLKDSPSGTIWDACTKLFAYKQLVRRDPEPIKFGITMPVGIAFFYNCSLDLNDPEIQDRVLKETAVINSLVAPEHRVNGLYVLNRGSFNWAFLERKGSRTFTTLQHLSEAPRPTWLAYYPTGRDTLYRFYRQLWSTLSRTQLPAPDLLHDYGADERLGSGAVRGFPCSIEAVNDMEGT